MLAGIQTNLTQVIHGFPMCLQANARIVPWLSYDCFLLNPIQFIIHPSSHCAVLYHWATSIVIKLTDKQFFSLQSCCPLFCIFPCTNFIFLTFIHTIYSIKKCNWYCAEIRKKCVSGLDQQLTVVWLILVERTT